MAFQAHEKRDAMYKTATRLIDSSWGNTTEMVDGLGVLLLTWNQAFYRYGSFDFEILEKCIAQNLDSLTSYRNFFPLWDDKIATAYKCHYQYIPFMQEMKKLAEILAPTVDEKITGKTVLKLIDEYNYAKFTKAWI